MNHSQKQSSWMGPSQCFFKNTASKLEMRIAAPIYQTLKQAYNTEQDAVESINCVKKEIRN